MMKNYKNLTILTGLISVISIVVIILSVQNSVIYDLAMALFGSGVLGLIMSLSSYLVERKRAMELFYQEAALIVDQLMTIQYLDYHVPPELLDVVLAEETKVKDGYFTSQNPTEQQLFQWCIASGEIMNTNDSDNLKRYQQILDEEKAKIDRFMNECICFSKTSLRGINDAYGNLDFMFGNVRIRKDLAYDGIYNELKMIVNRIRNETYHFNLYQESKGNYYACYTKVNEINDMLYHKIICKDSEYNDEYEVYEIYATKKDSIESSLERFRREITHERKDPEHETSPVICAMKARNTKASSENK